MKSSKPLASTDFWCNEVEMLLENVIPLQCPCSTIRTWSSVNIILEIFLFVVVQATGVIR